jgi:hypothetical protein
VIDRSTTRDNPLTPMAPSIGSQNCLELVSRKPSWPAFMCDASTGRTYGRKRSDQNAAKDLARMEPVRRQWRLAGTNRWLDGISVHTQNRTFRYKLRTGPEAAGPRRPVTSAFADFCSSAGSPGNWPSLR